MLVILQDVSILAGVRYDEVCDETIISLRVILEAPRLVVVTIVTRHQCYQRRGLSVCDPNAMIQTVFWVVQLYRTILKVHCNSCNRHLVNMGVSDKHAVQPSASHKR